MKYRPEIDGLRTIAVGSVILYHAGLAGFAGGFSGVDVFFVISGYLITTIIVGELDEGRFSILKFYERRARRILPALFFVLSVTALAAWYVLLPSDFEDFARAVLSTTLFYSNILFWMQSGYFEAASELNPLVHTWSLAVEEQYYIFFPLIAILVWRWRRRYFPHVLLALLVLSFLLCILAPMVYPHPKVQSAAFFMLPTRAWELLIGAGAALAFRYRRPRLEAVPMVAAQALSLLGLALILGTIAWLPAEGYPNGWGFLPTGGTALIILFARPGTWVNRLLSLKLLVGIGLISYSLYLWHQPVFALYRYAHVDHLSWIEICALIAVSVALAWVSWAWVERPFRHRNVVANPLLWSFSGAGAVVMLVIGGTILAGQGFPNRGWIGNYTYASYTPDNRALRVDSWQPLEERAGYAGYRSAPERGNQAAWFDPEDPRVPLLLVGNSHSKDVYNALAASETARARFQLARFGAEIVDLGRDPEPLLSAPAFRRAEVVMIVARYGTEDLPALAPLVDRLETAGKQVVLVRNIFEFDIFGYYTLADRIIMQGLEAVETPEDMAALRARVNQAYYEEYATRGRRLQPALADDEIDRLAATYPDLIVLDRMDYICDRDAERCLAAGPELEKTFYDYGHNTLQGARLFGTEIDRRAWLAPLLDRLEIRDEARN